MISWATRLASRFTRDGSRGTAPGKRRGFFRTAWFRARADRIRTLICICTRPLLMPEPASGGFPSRAPASGRDCYTAARPRREQSRTGIPAAPSYGFGIPPSDRVGGATLMAAKGGPMPTAEALSTETRGGPRERSAAV